MFGIILFELFFQILVYPVDLPVLIHCTHSQMPSFYHSRLNQFQDGHDYHLSNVQQTISKSKHSFHTNQDQSNELSEQFSFRPKFPQCVPNELFKLFADEVLHSKKHSLIGHLILGYFVGASCKPLIGKSYETKSGAEANINFFYQPLTWVELFNLLVRGLLLLLLNWNKVLNFFGGALNKSLRHLKEKLDVVIHFNESRPSVINFRIYK